jgi:hypothetical protein
MVTLIRHETSIALVGTVPAPNSDLEQPGNAYEHRRALVDAFNARIRQLAVEPHVYLVDVARVFGEEPGLTSNDGRLLTQSGYDRIAEAFGEVLERILTARGGSGGCADRREPPRLEPTARRCEE